MTLEIARLCAQRDPYARGATGPRGGWGRLSLEPAGRCRAGDWLARESVGTCVRARARASGAGRCVERWGGGGTRTHALCDRHALSLAPQTLIGHLSGARAHCLGEGWPRKTPVQSRTPPRCAIFISPDCDIPPPSTPTPTCPWRTWPLHAGKRICRPAHPPRVRV